ncbi:hypothetical protein [Mucilaginibacter myungsuensis]|uniref:Uncharacterized protein n=1 Tax=Mucilaginibacter myungsuensis TaxID=649104 RepID=A0A929KX83_9SPHI|nr:hypothetical protein [Mucilaginibacter myungsuensis]MBE9662140.1 hypothetical protein [Mucilaginibacter myungsuensis]MDN3599426.1 hypothetical protein [Mucilaginibacter myungsuensis]
MALTYLSLDDVTREYMLKEFQSDLDCDNCYLSKRFNDFGNTHFIEIMPQHIATGDDASLTEALKSNNCFKSHEERNKNGTISMVKVPVTAAETFAEGEFNRFYIRAICLRALTENRAIEVYRARASSSPRPESEALIGNTFDPKTLLQDLRDNKGVDTSFGLPAGPNSGLSIKII